MSNQEKFKQIFESNVAVYDINWFVDEFGEDGYREDLGKFELKEKTNEYGSYGQADLTFVYHFVDLDLYVRFYGYYHSYDGMHFTKYEFANPVEKLVTVYE